MGAKTQGIIDEITQKLQNVVGEEMNRARLAIAVAKSRLLQILGANVGLFSKVALELLFTKRDIRDLSELRMVATIVADTAVSCVCLLRGINPKHVADSICSERQRQDAKWGQQDHNPIVWAAILTEEYGEAADAFYNMDEAGMYAELVQVAAVAVAFCECVDRAEWQWAIGENQ